MLAGQETVDPEVQLRRAAHARHFSASRKERASLSYRKPTTRGKTGEGRRDGQARCVRPSRLPRAGIAAPSQGDADPFSFNEDATNRAAKSASIAASDGCFRRPCGSPRSETVCKCSRADRALLSDGPNDAACGSCVVRRQLILLVDHLVVFGKRR
jgi:hypothetical protein